MTTTSIAELTTPARGVPRASEAATSSYAVSWAAILAGTLAATGSSLVLITLGSGLGLAIVSPWPGSGATGTTFAVSAAVWLVVVQWLSSGLGGYLAGRLHVKAAGAHTDEIYFRDTAHGFLAWALSTLVVAVLLGTGLSATISGAGSAVGSAANGIAATAGRSASSAATGLPTDYAVDQLFRAAAPQAGNGTPAGVETTPQGSGSTLTENRAEAGRILVDGLGSGQLSDTDKTFLVHTIATSAGLSDADAQKRVDTVVARWNEAKLKARQAADVARKSAMTAAVMTALALIVGAFIASVAGALGGFRRDAYQALVRRSL